MIGPEELEKLFSGGFPLWIERQLPEKKQSDSICFIEKLKSEDITPDGHISISGKLGIVGTSRMYGFYKENPTRAVSQNARPYLEITAGDEMAPIGKHPLVKSKPFAKGLWFTEGQIESGTIIKVFIGFTSGVTYGMSFYIADTYAKKIRIYHPEGDTFIEGKLTEVKENMYAELGLKRLPLRAKGIIPNILEV